MMKTEIKLGTVCNNNCLFCLNELKNISKPLQSVLKEIKIAKEAGIDTISLTGGEPTIREDLISILNYSKSLGLKVHIQTNARMFSYAKFIEKVLSIDDYNFLISLHAHNKELNSVITQTNDSFEQTIKGIKNLVEMGKNISINIVVNKKNVKYLKKIAEHHALLNVNTIQFSWVRPQGKALASMTELIPKFSDNIKYLKEAINYLKNKKINIVILNVPRCILKEHQIYLRNAYRNSVIIDGQQTKNCAEWVKKERKTYLKSCKNCNYYNSCDGIFKEYVNNFGDEEFKIHLTAS